MRFSVFVPAYKEKEINRVLKLLLTQTLPAKWKMNKIYVVACGYKNFNFLKNRKIQVVRESRRSGKAYALNLALRMMKSIPKTDVIVVHNADVFPKKNMLRNLLKVFEISNVGMTCVRPVSLDNPENFLGFLNNVIWELHHLISLESTKVGEVFAFRNMIKRIPKRLAADEAYIESVVRKKGYKIIYVPSAVVFNRGPQTISEFIDQRKRIFTGHVHIENKYHHKVSTMSTIRMTKAFFKYLKTMRIKTYKQIIWLPCAVILECYARLLGLINFYIFKKVPYVWKITESSRDNKNGF